jgi:hypothetical protein
MTWSKASTEMSGAGPRDATRGGVNGPALPVQRGRERRESPLWINMLPKYLGEWLP